jgi:hypothetical protein
MAFTEDGGGFPFHCDDAKMLIGGSGKWATHFSYIGRPGFANNKIHIISNLLTDIDYLKKVIGKRPNNIFIIANTNAAYEADELKRSYPEIRIALHKTNNAKIVLIEPDKVWVSSADFGKTPKNQINSTIGLHSKTIHDKIISEKFQVMWNEALEI